MRTGKVTWKFPPSGWNMGWVKHCPAPASRPRHTTHWLSRDPRATCAT